MRNGTLSYGLRGIYVGAYKFTQQVRTTLHTCLFFKMLYSKNVRENSEDSIAMPKLGPPPGQGNPTGDYQVQRGDTLTKIASRRLPPGASPAELQAMIQRIAKENGIADINRIQAGANLKLPPNAGMGPAPGSAPSAPPIDEALPGRPSNLPSAPPPVPPPSLSPTGMRGTAIPSSIPMPMPSTGGGMPGPMPSITPPTADQIKVSSAPGSLPPASQRGGFSFPLEQVDPTINDERADYLNTAFDGSFLPPADYLNIATQGGEQRYITPDTAQMMGGAYDSIQAPPSSFKAKKFKQKSKKSSAK